MAFAENLAAFFSTADFAVTALWTPSAGGPQQSAEVILDAPDEESLDGRVLSREYTIFYPANEFIGLAKEQAVTVNGVAYSVRAPPEALDDGQIMRARLRKT